MKPGNIEWATDLLFPAGADPWSATPNKIRPPHGKVATGRTPGERPPVGETNWWRWAVAQKIRELGGAQVGSLLLDEFDFGLDLFEYLRPFGLTLRGTFLGDVQAIFGDDATRTYMTLMPAGRRHYAGTDMISDAMDPSWDVRGAACDRAGRFAVAMGSRDRALRVAELTPLGPTIGNWWNGLPPGYTTFGLGCLPYGAPNERWVTNGADGSSPYFAVDTGVGLWTVAGTPPAFAPMGVPQILRSSQHLPDDLWPGDPGNPVFMLISPLSGQVSTSPDGDVWGVPWAGINAGALGWVLDYGYGAWDTTWIAVLRQNLARDICVSVDNGLTWETRPALTSSVNLFSTGSWARITTNGCGSWLLVVSGGPLIEYHASTDNGATWHRVYPQISALANSEPQVEAGSLWSGGGQICTVTHNNDNMWPRVHASSSLRFLPS
jgi:hypothetical protein